MSEMNRILVLTSGGDAPGMNAAIRAVVRSALHLGLEVYGCESGFAGLVQEEIFPMDERSVANCIQRGGTILKTARCPAFFEPEIRTKALQFLQKKGIDGLVILGGNGSFQGGYLLSEQGGPKVIGIPCTIDNDINGTDYCIGFDTARNTALSAIDNIRDTAFSHERNFIIEVMGRSSGFIAVDVGIGGGAEMIVTPEFPMGAQDIVNKISERRDNKSSSIIVVAEADEPGHSVKLAADIEAISGIQYRVCILGHTQRGGTPTAMDRSMGSLMGYHAVKALLAGDSGKMTAWKHGELSFSEFPDPEHATRLCSDAELLRINQLLS